MIPTTIENYTTLRDEEVENILFDRSFNLKNWMRKLAKVILDILCVGLIAGMILFLIWALGFSFDILDGPGILLLTVPVIIIYQYFKFREDHLYDKEIQSLKAELIKLHLTDGTIQTPYIIRNVPHYIVSLQDKYLFYFYAEDLEGVILPYLKVVERKPNELPFQMLNISSELLKSQSRLELFDI